jgi:hypothetical protein
MGCHHRWRRCQVPWRGVGATCPHRPRLDAEGRQRRLVLLLLGGASLQRRGSSWGPRCLWRQHSCAADFKQRGSGGAAAQVGGRPCCRAGALEQASQRARDGPHRLGQVSAGPGGARWRARSCRPQLLRRLPGGRRGRRLRPAAIPFSLLLVVVEGRRLGSRRPGANGCICRGKAGRGKATNPHASQQRRRPRIQVGMCTSDVRRVGRGPGLASTCPLLIPRRAAVGPKVAGACTARPPAAQAPRWSA